MIVPDRGSKGQDALRLANTPEVNDLSAEGYRYLGTGVQVGGLLRDRDWVDQQVADAERRGVFDDLPGTAGLDSLPARRIRDNWWFIPTLILGSSGVRLLAAVALIHSHREMYAIIAGMAMLLLALLVGFANTRR